MRHLDHLPTILLVSVLSALLAVNPVHAAGGASDGRAIAGVVNVRVSHDTFAAHSEPAIAENPRNPRNLIAGSKFFTDPAHYRFKIGTFYSMDGGRSWHDSGLLPGFDGYQSVSDISIAFSRKGVAYVTVLACDGGICPGTTNRTGIFVSKSIDGGKSFSNPVAVYLDDSGGSFSDKPWATVDDTSGPDSGTIYVAWNLDPIPDPCGDKGGDARATGVPSPGGIVVSRSIDGGQTFSAPVVVLPFTDHIEAIGAIPAVSPDGQVSVTYSAVPCSGGIDEIDIATSTDGAQTFSAPHAVTGHINALPFHLANGTFRTTTMPTFVVSPRTGALVIAWADMRNGDADIFSVRSADSGATWSSPQRVNHDALHNGKDQFMPELAVAPNGVFTCAWFDRRHDPKNTLIDEDIAQSSDDGRSFGRNIRVTARSWDPAIDAPQPEGRAGNTFIGDYQALAVDNGTAHPLWNDTQNGNTQEIRTVVMSTRLFTRR